MSNPYHCTCTLDTVVLCFLMPVLLVMILALLRTESVEFEAEHVDDRSVDDLLSFINGENGDSKEVKAPKNKKKKSRRKDQQKNAPPVCTVSDTSSSPNNAIKEPNGVSSVGHDDKMMKSYIWLQTADGSIQQVEQEVAIFCPFICHKIHAGVGSSKTYQISLPERVNPVTLSLILDYCRFHQVAGRSNEERKSFDEKFIPMDRDRLCELISAADSLQLKPLVDLTCQALSRMIKGKTPEEIREKEKLLKREGFTWFESVWRWVQTPWISRKSRLQKKKKEEKLKWLQDLEYDFDDCDEIDREKIEQLDREVEDFTRRLNSDWRERVQELLSLGQDRRPSLYTVNGNGCSAKRSSSTGLEKHEK